MNIMIYPILATTLVSLLSLVGFVFYRFRHLSFALVSLAVGALLGDAFIHILPESFEALPPLSVSWLIFLGIVIFFSLEKFIRWHHCHDPDCHQARDIQSHIVPISIIGDTLHNFIDGTVIAAAFMSDVRLGWITTLAVILHEIPQEIGDIGILLQQGIHFSKALKVNLFSSFSAILGCLLVLLIGQSLPLENYLLPVTAGGFIYLTASDLIPELHRHHPAPGQSFVQIVFVILGFSLMALLLVLE